MVYECTVNESKIYCLQSVTDYLERRTSLMKLIIILALFMPIFYNCAKKKKWYLNLFYAFYPILPDSFAIEISKQLPLLSAKRIIILLLIVIWIYKTMGKIKLKGMIPVMIYVFFETFVSCVNFRYGSGEVNRLFILVFETFIPFLMVNEFVKNENEIKDCLDFLLMASAAVFLISMLQVFANYDVTTVLSIVDGRVDTSLTQRMGVERARGFFNAISYGGYCSFLVIIALYRFLDNRKSKYLIYALCNFGGLILSMSRSSLVPLVVILIVIFLKEYNKLLVPIIKMSGFVVLSVIILLFIKPDITIVIFNLINSMLNTLGFNVNVSSAFGANANASVSRLMQYSLFNDFFKNGGWIFGRGYNAFKNGMLYYYYPMWGKWAVATMLDIGVVAEFASSGLIGLCTLTVFIICMFKPVKSFVHEKKYDISYLMKYEIALYLILAFVTSCMKIDVFWLLLMLYIPFQRIATQNNGV